MFVISHTSDSTDNQGLTTPFLTLLTNLLYTQPMLLTPLLRGLSQLVSSNQRLANSATEPEELRKQFGIDQAMARDSIAYLKTLAKDMVSVLLNVFSKLPREQRGPVGDVIGAWVGIMTEEVSSQVAFFISLAKVIGCYRSLPNRDYSLVCQPHLDSAVRTRCFPHLPHHARSAHHLRPLLTSSSKLGSVHCYGYWNDA